MTLANKTADIAAAIKLIPDGASVMVGGFGSPGTPFCLIEQLVKQGSKNLTIIKNDANQNDMGIDLLLQNGQVDKLITSHIGLNSNAIALMNAGSLEVEFVPQGILAERIRIAGAGLLAFVTDVGIDTSLANGKQTITLKGVDGVAGILETALSADFALIHAARADTFGNLSYAATAQNFNPAMAMAARLTIAETTDIVPLGDIDPDCVHTPAPFVDKLVHLPELTEAYNVIKR
ncbi:MAG: acetate CoA-transferase [Hyphomicrobiales bacterium]|nr:MAG: acetate CoA-transferase [Hyphomicrobiales bacterium]